MTRGLLDHLIGMARDVVGQLEIANETFAELSATDEEYPGGSAGDVNISKLQDADFLVARAIALVDEWIALHHPGAFHEDYCETFERGVAEGDARG